MFSHSILKSYKIFDIIQVPVGALLEYQSFRLYQKLCDYLKGFVNHDKMMLNAVVLWKVPVRCIFKRAGLDPKQDDYFSWVLSMWS